MPGARAPRDGSQRSRELLTALVALLPLVVLAQATPPSVLTGVFNEAQAVRGQALYFQHCLACHGETLAGLEKAPPLAGPQFATTWTNAPLAALVTRILTMPPDKPGALSREQSVDVLSYVLWYNGLPLGEAELASSNEVLSGLTLQLPLAQ